MWKTLCYKSNDSTKKDILNSTKSKLVSSSKYGVNVVCLSEGSIDSEISHFGADLVSNRASEYFSLNFESIYNGDIYNERVKLMEYILESLLKKTESLKCDLKDLASSLLIVSVKDSRFISMFLGNGMIGYYNNSDMEVLLSQKVDKKNYTTNADAVESMLIKKGNLKEVKGFALMSSSTQSIFYQEEDEYFEENFEQDILKIVKTKSIDSNKLKDLMVENPMTNSDKDFDIALLCIDNSQSRYYFLSDEQKVSFFKFPVSDTNSINRVRDLDNILKLIENETSIDKLSSLLNIKSNYLKRKLDILVNNNLLSVNKENIYKKIN